MFVSFVCFRFVRFGSFRVRVRFVVGFVFVSCSFRVPFRVRLSLRASS